MLKSTAPADHVAFASSEADCTILRNVYADSRVVRLPLLNAERLGARLPAGPQRWIDPELDGLHHWSTATHEYVAYIKRFARYDQILDDSFQKKPQKAVVREFVNAVLDACMPVQPAWLTVPQLPVTTDVAR